MAWLKKKADPLSDRAGALNAEIAALEAQIKRLDAQLQRGEHPRLRSTAVPHGATITHTTSATVLPPVPTPPDPPVALPALPPTPPPVPPVAPLPALPPGPVPDPAAFFGVPATFPPPRASAFWSRSTSPATSRRNVSTASAFVRHITTKSSAYRTSTPRCLHWRSHAVSRTSR